MRSVIKKDRVRLEELDPAASPGEVGVTGACQRTSPGLRVVHLEGRVHALELTCACGEVSVIEIEYESDREESPR